MYRRGYLPSKREKKTQAMVSGGGKNSKDTLERNKVDSVG